MSVTLKLADEDAAVVGSILKALAEEMSKAPRDAESMKDFFYRLQSATGRRSIGHIMDIAGAFQIAVRANQR